MRIARLVLVTAAVTVAGTYTVSTACDQTKTTSAVTASSKGATCSPKGAKVSAVTAAADAKSGDCCAAKGAKSAAHTGRREKVQAVVAGASCHGEGMSSTAARAAHSGCEACLDMATCNEQLEAAGATVQIVPIKNGVMYVYTATHPGAVRAVQAAMSRRNQRMSEMTQAGENVKLCRECKAMRGAAASGKLVREVVNIDGGVLTMMTSSDPSVVSKIHQIAGLQTATRVKS